MESDSGVWVLQHDLVFSADLCGEAFAFSVNGRRAVFRLPRLQRIQFFTTDTASDVEVSDNFVAYCFSGSLDQVAFCFTNKLRIEVESDEGDTRDTALDFQQSLSKFFGRFFDVLLTEFGYCRDRRLDAIRAEVTNLPPFRWVNQSGLMPELVNSSVIVDCSIGASHALRGSGLLRNDILHAMEKALDPLYRPEKWRWLLGQSRRMFFSGEYELAVQLSGSAIETFLKDKQALASQETPHQGKWRTLWKRAPNDMPGFADEHLDYFKDLRNIASHAEREISAVECEAYILSAYSLLTVTDQRMMRH